MKIYENSKITHMKKTRPKKAQKKSDRKYRKPGKDNTQTQTKGQKMLNEGKAMGSMTLTVCLCQGLCADQRIPCISCYILG